MTTISIRPIGQEAPVITGEVVSEGEYGRFIQIAPDTPPTPFSKEHWEPVPVPPESLASQVERLAQFIMDKVPGEPSQNEGAIDTAIRLLGELVPEVAFVFPTAFGARITGVNTYGDKCRLFHAGNGDWWDRRSNRWTENNITELLTDLRVVDAGPDWGDE
ncbi:hypothetical protein [Glaciibacter flavus]|uniref:hypothetical protein n=1 Tax=Orlajensenia flava TaxID=2565934 RepID=UPI003B00274A